MSLLTITCACAAPHKGKRAIELSLHVARVNDGLGLESLSAGLQLAACVRSTEDHGFLLSLGIQVASHGPGATSHLSVRAAGLLAGKRCKCSTFSCADPVHCLSCMF